MTIPAHQITALLLAGGRGSRMGGLDKGLQAFHGEPLAQQVLRRIAPQAGTVLISANRHFADYRRLGAEVITDELADYQGPLAGIHAGLRHCSTPWLLTVPCDSPFVPTDLAQSLGTAIIAHNADLAYVVTGSGQDLREHPVFSLMRASLRDSLGNYLDSGARKVRDWHTGIKSVAVRIDDEQAFRNLNTIDELAQAFAPDSGRTGPG